MIKIEKNKLVIEIETSSPAETLCEINRSLIELIQSANPDTGNNTVDTTLSLLKSLMLNRNQIKEC